MAKAATVESLLDKGQGTLIKRGTVWSYPGAPEDSSGTNLRVPLEVVSDAAVQDAIRDGFLVHKMVDSFGVATAVVRAPAEGETVRLVSLVQAGSVEAATEMPRGARPTHDAGRRLDKVDEERLDAARARILSDPAPVDLKGPGERKPAA